MSSDILSRPLTGRRSCLVSAGLAFVTSYAVGVKTAERRYR